MIYEMMARALRFTRFGGFPRWPHPSLTLLMNQSLSCRYSATRRRPTPKLRPKERSRQIFKTRLTPCSGVSRTRSYTNLSPTILSEMLRFFDWLARIENNLQKLDTLLESLSLLEVLEFEARSLTDYIETRAIPASRGNERLSDVLDGISYGITHDLRRVFERELVRGVTEQSIPIVYGKIMHAHGLLTNCFQQSTITLLQVFKPNVDGSKLFNDVELRLEQSLILCKDLSSLMRFVRLAQAKGDPDVLRSVTARILEFRDGSMQYLMYKDWRGYESLALEVITAIENNLDPKPLLHRFICYLEVLYGHVKMRAVLADEFPYSGKEEE